jgi:outer membrane protein assembly factor BamA
VGRGGFDLRLGRPLSRHWAWDGWVTLETFDADSTAEIGTTRETQGLEKGQEVPYDDLPPGVQSGVGRRQQTRLGLALGLDSRRGRSFTTRGLWGRTQFEAVYSKDGSFPRGEVDLRGYARAGRHIQLATRVRAAAVGDNAPFYQRFYVGGLYTVRGYPNQSLSPPGGNTRAAYASVELRTLWVGKGSDPLLVAFAFLDAGVGWNQGAPELDTVATSIGYGVSLGLPWIDRLGLHVGFPLEPSPVNEAFHLNLSIGWTY